MPAVLEPPTIPTPATPETTPQVDIAGITTRRMTYSVLFPGLTASVDTLFADEYSDVSTLAL
ncbi:MAG: hypothetical protein H8F28_22900 [Fibrella sp.]|nr:hypothetical protein [Armatimonadota bacterium]